MNFDLIQSKSKQFRAPRTRTGKIIKNRIGGYERSRSCDDCYGPRSRSRLLQDALDQESRRSLIEALSGTMEPSCCMSGEIPAAGTVRTEPVENFVEGLDPRFIVVRYGKDGKLSSAHCVGRHEASRFMR